MSALSPLHPHLRGWHPRGPEPPACAVDPPVHTVLREAPCVSPACAGRRSASFSASTQPRPDTGRLHTCSAVQISVPDRDGLTGCWGRVAAGRGQQETGGSLSEPRPPFRPQLAMGKMMEQGPVLIITFQAQLVMVIKNPKGELVEGDPVSEAGSPAQVGVRRWHGCFWLPCSEGGS